MKQKMIKMKFKKKPLEFGYVEFETLLEALDHISEQEVIKIYNFGARELSKALAQGKDPFSPKKRTLKISTKSLNQEQIEALVRAGLLESE
jgi:Cys-tRNA synthase (O-phospho-L-seryl-tRNA:Cys-tRNA synthase)